MLLFGFWPPASNNPNLEKQIATGMILRGSPTV
jgi:hypothetical protein